MCFCWAFNATATPAAIARKTATTTTAMAMMAPWLREPPPPSLPLGSRGSEAVDTTVGDVVFTDTSNGLESADNKDSAARDARLLEFALREEKRGRELVWEAEEKGERGVCVWGGGGAHGQCLPSLKATFWPDTCRCPPGTQPVDCSSPPPSKLKSTWGALAGTQPTLARPRPYLRRLPT
jgi:hypothetical protein